jgi:hypothetical protein
MTSKRAAWVAMAILLAESILIVALPSRIPRAPRLVTGLVNLAAATALLILLLQRRDR